MTGSLDMTIIATALDRAVAFLKATRGAKGWAWYDQGTNRHYTAGSRDLVKLGEALRAGEDDAYSLWCQTADYEVVSQSVTVQAKPCDVPVSDARGSVKGASVTLTFRVLGLDLPETEIEGTVIPKEGDSLDAWLGDLASVADDREVIDAIAVAAAEGARGRKFFTSVEVDYVP